MLKSKLPKSKHCQNPNFFVFGFQTFGFQTFGLFVFLIVRFDLLCIEPNKNRSVLYHSLVFRQKKTSEGEAAWSNGYHLGLRRGRSAVQISPPPFQSFFGIQTFREVSPYRTSPTGGISESNDPNRRREE